MTRYTAPLLALALLALEPASALADGSKVRRWLTTTQVVQRSQQILVCELVAVDHEWRTARAYGKDRKYVARYQVQAKVVDVVRGPANLKGSKLWLQKRGQSRPGRWVLIREGYSSSFSLHQPKKRSRFLVYIASAGVKSIVTTAKGKRAQVPVFQVDAIAKLAEVRKLAKLPRRTGKPNPPRTR